MTTRSLRIWYGTHKWASLICTAFLLLLCVTGLPLIFHAEIDRLGARDPAFAPGIGSAGDGHGLWSLDAMLRKALAARPGEVPLFMAFDNDRPLMTITTGPSPDAPVSEMTLQSFDRLSGAPVRDSGQSRVTDALLRIHTDLLLGLPGELFLGAMGLLFVAAIVSGVVLYAPFMRKLPFATIRADRGRRVRWLDTHNMLGAVTLAWASVVGLTGVINTLATPIVQLWQRTELAEMTRAYAGRPALPPSRYGSIDRAMAAARRALPGNNPQFIAFPGGGVQQPASLCRLLPGRDAAHPPVADASAARCRDRPAHRCPDLAVVRAGVARGAAAAFWRLWRPAAQDPVGVARPVHDRRARFRPLSVARPSPADRGAPSRDRNGRRLHACHERLMSPPHRRSLRVIFAPLLAIGAVSLIGLIAALAGDGIANIVSWVALGVPVVVAGWSISNRRK